MIRNNLLTFPQMEIHSNAFNINASGTHNFDGYFNYKLNILLSEVLAQKAKRKNEEYFYEEPDGRRASLFLSIYGTSADFKVKYDKKEAVESVRQDLKEEKETLKDILNQEFGWFKKDTLKKEEKDNKGGGGFILEWDDEDTVKNKNKVRKKPEEDFILEWGDEDI